MFAKLSRHLVPSILSLLLNIPLVLSGLHRSSFDIYNHIFFADHYRQRWFELIEPRWFGGFNVASYPPLVHQLIALISLPFSILIDAIVETLHATSLPGVSRYLGEEIGYVIVLLTVLALMPLAVQRFAKIFVPSRAARAASWLSLALPSLYLTAYSFGQLPTLAASAALMWAMGTGWEYVRGGRKRDLFSAVLWAGVTALAHHAVLLFALIAGGAMAMQVPHLTGLAESNTRQIVNRPVRRCAVSRFLIWAAASAAFAAVVIYPFILWSRGYTPQTPIDHLSRHNLFTEWMAFYYFFAPMYGAMLVVLPIMIIRFTTSLRALFARQSRLRFEIASSRKTLLAMTKHLRHLPLILASLLLFTLGLGGTTPLPSLLFGSNWEWLTYDRFSFWCGLTWLPFAAVLWRAKPKAPIAHYYLLFTSLLFCLFAAFSSVIIQAQPQEYDLDAIARFLNQQTNYGDRYLTFGFGDQVAKLSVLTNADTIDGSYFTARTMPELRQSGIGSLDGALWNPKGVESIKPFLDRAHEWGVRWVFTAHIEYTVALLDADWELMGKIAPGVLMWKNRNEVKTDWVSPAAQASPDLVASIWWGVVPLITLAMALLLNAETF